MLRKFMSDVYPKAFACFIFVCIIDILKPSHKIAGWFLITASFSLFVVVPLLYYPTWRKRQSFSADEESAFKERRNINLISFGLWIVLGIPLILLICVFTKSDGIRQVLVILAALALYLSIYHIVRKKLHHYT